MEVLSRMLSTASQSGLITGFSIGRLDLMSLDISHLLFADDTITFCDNNCEQIVNLRCILLWFEIISGLRVTFSRSSILPGKWRTHVLLQVFWVAS